MKVINGNNIDILKQYPDNYFDAIVTDPPYGLGKEPNAEMLMRDWIEKGYHEVGGSGFMGKEWDAFVPQPIFWKEVFRVLKHGGHVLSFFGTRTYDWGVMAMRFAGFEVRDCIQWLYGSGFPKSYNVAKGIEGKIINGSSSWNDWKKLDGEKEQVNWGYSKGQAEQGYRDDYTEANKERIGKVNFQSEQAKQWDGWGSALKPAHEDLVLARKPFKFSSDFLYLYESIVYNLKLQICQSKLFAKDVKEIFTLSQKELQWVELDFAQWSVGKPFNTKEDLLVLMDMLQLEMKEGNTTLNIVLLWLNTLVELWNVANTYTTETESSTITELRILNSLEWESIFQNITLLKDNKINGLIANVLTAESLFSVLNLKLNDILTHSAKESVTLKESEKTFVPNSEQIVLARKPLEKGLSIAENVLKWGVGAINIDGCRVGFTDNVNMDAKQKDFNTMGYRGANDTSKANMYNHQGRFPANLILSCSCENENEHNEDCPIKILDEQSGESKSSKSAKLYVNDTEGRSVKNGASGHRSPNSTYADKGGASRFFQQCNFEENNFVRFQYTAKASKSERNKGLEGFEEKQSIGGGGGIGDYIDDVNSASGKYGSEKAPNKNFHPTVKPIKLMQYLVRMITPPNGIVLDPFNGSGTTGIACKLEGFQFVGLEQDAEYTKIAQARIDNYTETEIQKIKKDTNENQISLF